VERCDRRAIPRTTTGVRILDRGRHATEFNVWITDSGYVGRASGVSDRELITQDFTGYGQPVSIPMLKADDIVNAPR